MAAPADLFRTELKKQTFIYWTVCGLKYRIITQPHLNKTHLAQISVFSLWYQLFVSEVEFWSQLDAELHSTLFEFEFLFFDLLYLMTKKFIMHLGTGIDMTGSCFHFNFPSKWQTGWTAPWLQTSQEKFLLHYGPNNDMYAINYNSHPSFFIPLLQLTYLGPPFNEKDFSPPRPNSTALSLPSAATRLELWHGLENQARLAQNQRAYSVLLAAVRELARSTLCPSLKTSLLHFCTGLDGLLGSISALMTTLGYSLPPSSVNMRGNGGDLYQYPQRGMGRIGPAPLMSQSLYRSKAGTRTESGRNNRRRSGTRVVRGEREDMVEKRRGKEGRRAPAEKRSSRSRGKEREERGSRGRREEPQSESWTDQRGGEKEEEGEVERWGTRRKLLSFNGDGGEQDGEVDFFLTGTEISSSFEKSALQINNNKNQYSFSLSSRHPYTIRKEDRFIVEKKSESEIEDRRHRDMVLTSSSHGQHRPPRSLVSPTLQPPLSTLSLLYQFGAGEEHTLLSQPIPLSLQRGTSLLSPPLTPLLSSASSSALLSVRPTMNDFARKVEGFWILRELQSWLWRSAKDFNRLKKRLRGWDSDSKHTQRQFVSNLLWTQLTLFTQLPFSFDVMLQVRSLNTMTVVNFCVQVWALQGTGKGICLTSIFEQR